MCVREDGRKKGGEAVPAAIVEVALAVLVTDTLWGLLVGHCLSSPMRKRQRLVIRCLIVKRILWLRRDQETHNN